MEEVKIRDAEENEKGIDRKKVAEQDIEKLNECKYGEKVAIMENAIAKIEGFLQNVKDAYATKDWLNGEVREKIVELRRDKKSVEERLLSLEREMTTLKNDDFRQKLEYQYKEEKNNLLVKCRQDLEAVKEKYDVAIKAKDDSLHDYEEKIAQLQEELGNTKEKAGKTKEKIDSLKEQNAKLQEKNTELEIYINDNKDKIVGYEELERTNREMVDQIRNTQERYESLQRDLDSTRGELQQAQDTIKTSDSSIEEINEEKSQLEGAIKDLKEAKVELSSKNKNLEKKIAVWKERMAVYEDVLDSMEQCDLFEGVLADKSIAGTREEKLFSLSLVIGKSLDFATKIYDVVHKHKQGNKDVITDQEANVYNAVNKCYRKVCGVDKDIFVLPGGQTMSAKFTKIQFDKNTMENLDNPREKSLKYATGVYVPQLNNLDGNMNRQARVKAGNI